MPPNNSGLGQPHEDEYFYRGYRDTGQGEPRPKDVVFDPKCDPELDRMEPERKKALDEFFCRFQRELKRLVFFSKRPSFVEPPFFSKPLIKAKCGLSVAPGATAIIFDRPIEARQRAIVSMIGLDVAPLLPLLSCALEFWFQQDNDIIPYFDDQSPTTYGGSTPVVGGRTSVIPGSVENPFCMITNGLGFEIKGPKRLTMRVENKSGVTVVIRGVLGLYQYWLAGLAGASEFETAELQQ